MKSEKSEKNSEMKSEMNRNDEQWKDLIEHNIVIKPNEWKKK